MSSEELPDTLTPSTPLVFDNATSLPQAWGRLVRRRTFLPSVELRNDSYSFGRKESCSIYVHRKNISNDVLLLISKEHFTVSRDYTSVPYLKDLSKNGTYVNKVLVGKGRSIALCDGDIIAVGRSVHEMYSFKDDSSSSVSEYFDEKYKITRFIGRGAFGEVHLAIDKHSCQRYAVKSIKITGRDEMKISNEIKIMENLQHPFIIKMIEAIYAQDYVYIVLEFMEGGELNSRVLRKQRLSESIAKLYLYQLARAVRYLHDVGITHRDLKPENVLLATKEARTILKVTDFGLSKIVGQSCVMNSLCGTPLYVAPEVLNCDTTTSYTPQVDIWSLGCISYFMLFGKTPFQQNDDDSQETVGRVLARVKKGEFPIPESSDDDKKDNVSKNAIDLVLKMLVVDPIKRIRVDDLIIHEWFINDAILIAIISDLLANK